MVTSCYMRHSTQNIYQYGTGSIFFLQSGPVGGAFPGLPAKTLVIIATQAADPPD